MLHQEAIRALAALGQDTRLAIFRVLSGHHDVGLPVGVIGHQLGIAPGTLSFHLKELTNAGLVTSRRRGTFIYYMPVTKALPELYAFLTDNCATPSVEPGVASETGEDGEQVAA